MYVMELITSTAKLLYEGDWQIPYHLHHKTYGMFSSINEHQRFKADKYLITQIIKLL